MRFQKEKERENFYPLYTQIICEKIVLPARG